MRRIIFCLMLMLSLSAQAQRLSRLERSILGHWTGTWATAQQVPVRSFMPFNNEMSNRSVRQIVKVSCGGDIVRLQLSNIFSTDSVEIRSVYIANALDSFEIDPKSAQYLRFRNRQRVVIPPGGTVISDAERFPLKALQKVAITINYKRAPKVPTVHMGSRTTSYILKGYSGPWTRFNNSFRYEKWFNIAALDVYTSDAAAIAILGNSITDGKGSTTNQQNRWPDVMSEYLNVRPHLVSLFKKARPTGILNLGIGNNRVLTTGYGEPAKDRFDRDILGQRGVTRIIVFEGINDFGASHDGPATARQLIEQYKVMINKAHARNLKIYGATITPFRGSSVFSQTREEGRQIVNEWIRTSKAFDGVIDFDTLMRNPLEKEYLRSEWCLGDHLHPNAEGYREMGRYAAMMMLRYE